MEADVHSQYAVDLGTTQRPQDAGPLDSLSLLSDVAAAQARSSIPSAALPNYGPNTHLDQYDAPLKGMADAENSSSLGNSMDLDPVSSPASNHSIR